MSLIETTHLATIAQGTREQALEAAKQAGKEYEPIWFEPQDAQWECALQCIRMKTQGETTFPTLTLENLEGDFSQPLEEIHHAARENPAFQANEAGNKALKKVKKAFVVACEEAFDPTQKVKALIKSIRQTLAVFLPILPGGDIAIPRKKYSGCDTDSQEWKDTVAWTKTHIIQAESKYPLEKALQELEDNANYGGEPGLLVRMDGEDFLKWMEKKSPWKVVQDWGKSKATLAVYDFGNGSGHDIESMMVAWNKIVQPPKARAGIINNFLEAVFHPTGNSEILIPSHLPNHGRDCYSNLWF
jgi:hypothetical protein